MPHWILLAATLISGACGIGYEILYLRALATVFGEMFYVHAALSAVFLLAFGAGARFAHRREEKLPHFLLAAGVYALIAPALLKMLTTSGWPALLDRHAVLTVAATALFLAAPALCVGTSIPLLSARLARLARGRPAFRRVYALDSAGAALGVLAVEFVIFRRIGLKASLALLGGLHIAAAGMIYWLDGRKQRAARREAPPPRGGPWPWPLALAGFASALFQMLFLKACLHIFQPHREVFALSLAVVLLGIPAGAWAVERFRLKFADCLLWALSAAGLFYCLHSSLLEDYLWLRQEWMPGASGAMGFARDFIAACLLGLPALSFFGGLLPAWIRSNQAVSRQSGIALWASSLGNSAGFLCYVFLGHPLLSSLQILLVMLALGAAALALHEPGFWKRRPRLTLLPLALAAAALALWSEEAFYLGRGVHLLPYYKLRVYKHGPDAAMLMQARFPKEDADFLGYNGYLGIDISLAGRLNITETFVGVYPALYAPSLERAAVIGLGSGMTAGFTARLFKKTDVLDLNQAFPRLARDIPYANLDFFSNSAATLRIKDARPFLSRQEGIYDSINNTTPSSAYFAAAKLYTAEFYAIVRRALKPGGVFTTWFDGGEYNEDALKIHLATLKNSFPHCALRILQGTYFALICSERPLRPRSWTELKVPSRVSEELAKSLVIYTPEEYLRHGELSRDIFKSYEPQAPLNTDDLPLLEFKIEKFPLVVDQTVKFITRNAQALGIDLTADLPPKGDDPRPFLLRTHIYYHLAHYLFDTMLSEEMGRRGLHQAMNRFHAERVAITRREGIELWARRHFLKRHRAFHRPPSRSFVP